VAEPKLARAGAYVDAVLGLQPRQIAFRPRRAVPPRLLALGLADEDAPGWRPLAAGAGRVSAPQSGPTEPPHLSGTFAAVGTARPAGGADTWASTGPDDLLFSFTVHGFDELPRYLAGARDPRGDAFWAGVVGDWLRRCSRPAAPAWHPYPLSRRIVAWCAALSAGGWDRSLEVAMRRSLTRQVRYLRRSVEHEVGGNHVLENAIALLVGGECLGVAGAARHGRRLLVRELPRQLLDDGGHFEGSPSYHRQVLDRLLDAKAVADRADAPLPELDSACRDMAGWLSELAGPDGRLPLLSDAWDGPPVASRADSPLTVTSSGYVVLRHGADQAVLDLAPLGPRHLPAHAHADALSFVLWADGTPLVVDPGSGGYRGPVRRWSRATASHNTVEIDGEDQCVFLGDFRAARLPRVVRAVDRRDDAVIVAARHDGYARLPDPVEHRRTYCWLPGDGLVVVDALHARGRHRSVSRLNLAAGGDERPGSVRARPLFDAPFERGAGRVAPYLGVFSPCTVLEQAADTGERAVQGWSLLRSEAEVRREGDEISVQRPDREPVRFTLA
jgi:uncharacterized heparinase superfamily protein